MTKKERETLAVMAILGLIGWGVVKVFQATGFVVPLVLCITAICAFVMFKQNQRKARIEYLCGKYPDETVVQKILQGQHWTGQTRDQLIDSRGEPDGKDYKMLKTIKREVWKYDRRGKNRYGLRITLDNDIVVGWDDKT
jgi:hypothetical protein